MKDAFVFGVKSFFAGCLGMLGAISILVVSTVLFGLIFKSQIQGLQENLTGKVESIPDLFSEGLSGMAEGAFEMDQDSSDAEGNRGQMADMIVYLTDGDQPDDEKLTTLSREQAAEVSIWVKSSPGPALSFSLELTLTEGDKMPLEEQFLTDPSGDAVFCGILNLTDPLPGNYSLSVFPKDSTLAAGRIDFEITE